MKYLVLSCWLRMPQVSIRKSRILTIFLYHVAA
uniref:Uncharacterized protein n=1 Tax=Arundo donax TaxID=35708 RepID=A0A0A9FZI6_ARUDO